MISIIVPVYNVEPYLERCVESLRHQTFQDIEIILVDDGSPDRCPALCDAYARNDSRIRVIHKKNAGLGMACNSGIEAARGEYIAFCDSDDWVEKDAYESMYSAAKEYHADAVYTGIRRVDERGRIMPMHQFSELKVYQGKTEILQVMMDMIASRPEDVVERRIQMSAKIVLYSAKIIRNHHLQFVSERELISEDLIFNLDFLSQASCICQLPKTFYNYFINSSSLTNQQRYDRFPAYKKLHQELLNRYSSLSLGNEFKIRVDRMFIGYVRHELITLLKNIRNRSDRRLSFLTIANDRVWDVIWGRYPIRKMPFKHRIFAVAQKYKLYWLAYSLSR